MRKFKSQEMKVSYSPVYIHFPSPLPRTLVSGIGKDGEYPVVVAPRAKVVP
jgi:hypothetical protein